MKKKLYGCENEELRLRVITEEDLDLIRTWRNGDNTRKWFKYNQKIHKRDQKKWYDSYRNNDDDVYFIIETKEENKPVGTIGFLVDGDLEAEVGRVMVGEEYRGAGYGLKALKLLLSYLFDDLGFLSIFLEVYKKNFKAINIYENCGFRIVEEFTYEKQDMIKMIVLNRRLLHQEVGIIGLGYVGLPLAVEYAKKGFDVIGYDVDEEKLQMLRMGKDPTGEIGDIYVKKYPVLYTSASHDLKRARFYIVTVPTQIDDSQQPDLKPLIQGTETLSHYLKKGDVVVFESTVYPGVTEEICLPILEKNSSLKADKDFTIGYSPERISPGDKTHQLTNIKKLVACKSETGLEIISNMYKMIIKAGIFPVSDMKVAEKYFTY